MAVRGAQFPHTRFPTPQPPSPLPAGVTPVTLSMTTHLRCVVLAVLPRTARLPLLPLLALALCFRLALVLSCLPRLPLALQAPCWVVPLPSLVQVPFSALVVALSSPLLLPPLLAAPFWLPSLAPSLPSLPAAPCWVLLAAPSWLALRRSRPLLLLPLPRTALWRMGMLSLSLPRHQSLRLTIAPLRMTWPRP